MTWGGWISMTLSIGLVTALFLWCCLRLVKNGANAATDDTTNVASDDDLAGASKNA